MKSPVREFKEAESLTVADVAVMSDVAPGTVWKAMTGETKVLNDRIVEVLEANGYEPEELRERYQNFREAKRKELVA